MSSSDAGAGSDAEGGAAGSPRQQVKLPTEPIDRLLGPIQRFMHIEAASGGMLLVATAVALGLANSQLAEGFAGFWKTTVGFQLGGFEMHHSLKHWINDGLMAVFFFVIGLEVKRELVIGELREMRRAILPIAAAIGGMVVPAGVYLALQSGLPSASGWGIPMATDIAFVVGCMAVLGPRVPHGLRVLLLSLAIADDIGAILVIAVGYTETIHWGALAWGAAGIALVSTLSRLGVRSLLVYAILGTGVWLAFHESGIHATIAGVVLGLMTPASAYLSETSFGRFAERAREVMVGGELEELPDRASRVRTFRSAAREVVSPLEYLEDLLHPWVGFLIMPVFALANAGVAVELSAFGDSVAIAIAAGLLLGKPVGILLACFLAVRAGIASLPEGVGWAAVAGGGLLTGIGFTMALFIAGLALDGAALEAAKVGILGASALAAVLGLAILVRSLPPPSAE